jgi:hypothetical protein
MREADKCVLGCRFDYLPLVFFCLNCPKDTSKDGIAFPWFKTKYDGGRCAVRSPVLASRPALSVSDPFALLQSTVVQQKRPVTPPTALRRPKPHVLVTSVHAAISTRYMPPAPQGSLPRSITYERQRSNGVWTNQCVCDSIFTLAFTCLLVKIPGPSHLIPHSYHVFRQCMTHDPRANQTF